MSQSISQAVTGCAVQFRNGIRELREALGYSRYTWRSPVFRHTEAQKVRDRMFNSSHRRHTYLVALALAGSIAVIANAAYEGGRGEPGLPTVPGSHAGQCVWTGASAMNAADLQQDETWIYSSYILGGLNIQDEDQEEGVLRQGDGIVISLSWGMEIWDWGYAENCTSAPLTLSKSTNSFGNVHVWRTFAAPGHVPHMIIDWVPKFRAEAQVKNPDGSCHVAGVMTGDCTELGAHVSAQGGAAADGTEHPQPLTVTVGPVEVPVASGNADTNTSAPISPYAHHEADIATATATFSCSTTVKVTCPGNWFDGIEEVECWLWDALPELDLHGQCKNCSAFHYETYGWTL